MSQETQYTFRHLTTEQGLSSNNVTAIFKDSKGFVWIGTKDGLNRFDGYSCKIFRHDPGDSTSLSGNNITCINEDNQGNLLIGTLDEGLNRFDFATERFTRFKHEPGDPHRLR
jgi:ligand-binding sensor domain-containing protein